VISISQLLTSICVLGAMALVFIAVKKTYAHSVTREDVENQFKAATNRVEDERYRFDGNSAVVVYEYVDEPKGEHNFRSLGHPLMIHRVCRNSFGEYFLFISGEMPFITHLSKERARAALQRDRVAYKREFGAEPNL
jgi:hypothetical protein